MFRAITRKAVADLRTRRLQTFLQSVVVAGAAAILMLSISVERAVTSSFDRVHDEANGAHVWFNLADPGVAEKIAGHPGVIDATPVYEQVRGVLMTGIEPDDVAFVGMGRLPV
jgi:hypothetical protein